MTKSYSTEHYTGGVNPNPVMALMEYLFRTATFPSCSVYECSDKS